VRDWSLWMGIQLGVVVLGTVAVSNALLAPAQEFFGATTTKLIALFAGLAAAYLFVNYSWKHLPEKKEKKEKDFLDYSNDPRVLGGLAEQKYSEKKKREKGKSFAELYGQ